MIIRSTSRPSCPGIRTANPGGFVLIMYESSNFVVLKFQLFGYPGAGSVCQSQMWWPKTSNRVDLWSQSRKRGRRVLRFYLEENTSSEELNFDILHTDGYVCMSDVEGKNIYNMVLLKLWVHRCFPLAGVKALKVFVYFVVCNIQTPFMSFFSNCDFVYCISQASLKFYLWDDRRSTVSKSIVFMRERCGKSLNSSESSCVWAQDPLCVHVWTSRILSAGLIPTVHLNHW